LAANVSIPLWFLRNTLHEARDAESMLEVSIPLWFSRNTDVQEAIDLGTMFPYHYGSHATVVSGRSVTGKFRRFPYHYGSHATDDESYRAFAAKSFHTTMVLTQQVNSLFKKLKFNIVSIPLWFSRNVLV